LVCVWSVVVIASHGAVPCGQKRFGELARELA
jgi:hypothetical protein